MAWFMRGVQSALFHYASCAPCTGYSDGRKRRKAAKEARKLREKLELEQPGAYYHPEPTGTNAYWSEEIAMGPGPPPRRSRKTNTTQRTGSRGLPTRGTQSSTLSKGGSSLDVDHTAENRLSDDTLDDDNDDETWNHKRYQREDEDLWGYDDHSTALEHTMTGSSVGGGGYQLQRPNVSRAGSYYVARVPPVNELHPPVVSLPSPDPSENRWMLQPPPKASVMAGKERAKNRSRSGSGASSRVELSLGRQVSTRQLMQKIERGQTPDRLTNSPNGSYSNLAHGRCKTPQARPPSATSSSPNRKRRDTAMARDLAIARTDTASTQHSSLDPSDITLRGSSTLSVVDVQVLRTRPVLSTVASSNSGQDENTLPEKPKPVYRSSTTSDLTSLSCLQDLVSPQALLNSRFVSAPLVEAKIRLPPSEEDMATRARKDKVSTNKEDDDEVDAIVNVPFDRESGPPEKDPAFRWSVDF
ncbi:hypothetical protein COCMIDRAFT_38142 [Bipolaris oryzae ATCC 44560]|uniref:Uncharacterized protein n=1 Tax=Bipolaris oryzae ATCC 44560 TaxID=930090 RepID=W6Z1U4_COCMI|nr:uncharacterized protein COCMIDRAFT_38142 [Bipolaris oryzae ATCC 44560]EUC43945.1 hypothetical protein COCMIDRAFT_38142 [Bipolaris oryzae ATCC 44560]